MGEVLEEKAALEAQGEQQRVLREDLEGERLADLVRRVVWCGVAEVSRV